MTVMTLIQRLNRENKKDAVLFLFEHAEVLAIGRFESLHKSLRFCSTNFENKMFQKKVAIKHFKVSRHK